MRQLLYYTRDIFSKLFYSLAGQDQPEHVLVRQVKLVADSLRGRQVVQRAHSAPECLCHHQVIPVNVQDLPSSLVDTVARQLLPTLRAVYPHLPQVVGHPHHQPMGKKAIWCWCLVIYESWDRGFVPQLQILSQFARVENGVRNPPLVLDGDVFPHLCWQPERTCSPSTGQLNSSRFILFRRQQQIINVWNK